jgi:hypothetical protein
VLHTPIGSSGPPSAVFRVCRRARKPEGSFAHVATKRTIDVSPPKVGQAQSAALRAWYDGGPGRYDEVKRIVQPTLAAHGHRDIMLPTMNAFVLSQHIPNVQLVNYPKSGHGHCSSARPSLCSIRGCCSMPDSPSPYIKDGNRLAGPVAAETGAAYDQGLRQMPKIRQLLMPSASGS